MHTARNLYTMLASLVFVTISLPTQASPQPPTCASIESESVACFEVTRIVDHEITIDGHTFGPADNLQEHTLTVSSSDNSERGARDWGHWSPYRNTYISWGTSWVRNQEIGYYHYRGTTQAGANIYQGKRIIQTKLSYRKNGTITGQCHRV